MFDVLEPNFNMEEGREFEQQKTDMQNLFKQKPNSMSLVSVEGAETMKAQFAFRVDFF